MKTASAGAGAGGATTLYLHVFDWPTNGELLVPGLKNTSEKTWLLADADKKPLVTEMSDDGLVLKLPASAPDAISSTIVLRIADPLHIEPVPIAESRDGSISLLAADARLHGGTFKYEVGGPLDDIGFWTDANDWTDWSIRVHKPGTYTVAALIASPVSGNFDVSVGGQSLHCAGPATANYLDFKLAILGTIDVPSAGATTLSVKPAKDGWRPMNLKSVHLIPQSPNR
jgi:alpha-L-fucosidase